MTFTSALCGSWISFALDKKHTFWIVRWYIEWIFVYIKIFAFKDCIWSIYTWNHTSGICISQLGNEMVEMGEIQMKWELRTKRYLRQGDGHVEFNMLTSLPLHLFENFCISKRWGFWYIVINNFTFIQFAWNAVLILAFTGKNHVTVPFN